MIHIQTPRSAILAKSNERGLQNNCSQEPNGSFWQFMNNWQFIAPSLIQNNPSIVGETRSILSAGILIPMKELFSSKMIWKSVLFWYVTKMTPKSRAF